MKRTYEHGTHALYKGGCRCDVCVTARSTYMKDYRARRRDTDGGTATDDRQPS